MNKVIKACLSLKSGNIESLLTTCSFATRASKPPTSGIFTK